MNSSHRAVRATVLALSSAAVAVAFVSACSSSDQGTTPSSSTATTNATPTSSVTAPATTSAPPVGPSSTVIPSTTSDQGPVGNAPTTRNDQSGPSQTVSGGNSASATTVRTPSPPTGNSLPGDNAPPQGNPGSPGRNN